MTFDPQSPGTPTPVDLGPEGGRGRQHHRLRQARRFDEDPRGRGGVPGGTARVIFNNGTEATFQVGGSTTTGPLGFPPRGWNPPNDTPANAFDTGQSGCAEPNVVVTFADNDCTPNPLSLPITVAGTYAVNAVAVVQNYDNGCGSQGFSCANPVSHYVSCNLYDSRHSADASGAEVQAPLGGEATQTPGVATVPLQAIMTLHKPEDIKINCDATPPWIFLSRNSSIQGDPGRAVLTPTRAAAIRL